MKYIKLVFGEVLFEQKERPTVVHLLYVLSILQEEQEAHIVVIENHLSALQHNITNQCSFCIHMGGGGLDGYSQKLSTMICRQNFLKFGAYTALMFFNEL